MRPQHVSLKIAVATFGASMIVGGLPLAAAEPAPAMKPSLEKIRAKISMTPRTRSVTITQTTDNLNLRQKPGAQHKSLVVLKKGAIVAPTGKTSGRWREVKIGSLTGWVSSVYLTSRTNAAPAPEASTGLRTTVNLNLRQNAGAHFTSLTVLPKGTVVSRAGDIKGAWWEVKAGSVTGWVSSHYLTGSSDSAPDPSPDSPPDPEAVAGADRWVDGTQPIYAKASLTSNRLAVQTGGSKVRLIKSAGAWSHIDTTAGHGWIPASSLVASEPQGSGNSTSYRWTASAANVRTGPALSYESLGLVAGNEKVSYLQSSDGWSKVATSKGTGWIKNTLLSSVEYHAPKQLQPMTRSMVKEVQGRFDASISAVGGSRAGSTGHSSGLAADFMIKDYTSASGIDAGDAIAAYLAKNHERLGISYLIWRDRLWLAEDGQWGPYSTGGWGKNLESSRGWNATTKHMDHIHAEISPSRADK